MLCNYTQYKKYDLDRRGRLSQFPDSNTGARLSVCGFGVDVGDRSRERREAGVTQIFWTTPESVVPICCSPYTDSHLAG